MATRKEELGHSPSTGFDRLEDYSQGLASWGPSGLAVGFLILLSLWLRVNLFPSQGLSDLICKVAQGET